ncbi:MAG: cob(I)yrinic acid a,c-diamide adenosyltransferase [Pseudomonadota bacterium]
MDKEKEQHYQDRMTRKKAVVEEKIKQADEERGVLIVNTGNGKGKSSAAFGVVARALGHGMRVGIVQFIKGRGTTGEEAFFTRFPKVSYHVTGDGFTWDTQNKEQDETTARAGWNIALKMLTDPKMDLVVLDEINIVLKYNYLPLEEVVEAMKNRPSMQHVILTGRGAPEGLIGIADTVTEMRMEKHAFKAGIKAQAGVEF